MSELRFANRATPETPPVGKTKLFVDEADSHLKQVDSNGNIIDITKPSAIIVPDNQVVVNELSDLPAAVAGAIQLEDNTNYIFAAPITTPNRFIVGQNSAFTANNTFFPIITYTGTGTMFTGVDASFGITQLTVDCPNAQVIDFSSPTNPIGNILSIFALGVLRCKKAGRVDNLLVCEILRSAFVDCTDGITVEGTTKWSVYSYSTVAFTSSSPTFVGTDFTASLHRSVFLENTIMRAPAGAVGITGASNSANLRSNELATVTNGGFSGGITPLSIISESDIRWEFQNNGGVVDSQKLADTFLTIPETVTNPGTGVFTTIGGGNWLSEAGSRFTVGADGEITYNSEQDADFSVIATATVEKVGGGSDQIALRISKNLSASAKTESVTQNSSPTSLACQGVFRFTQGDVVELAIANNTGASDMMVSVANLIVTRL